MGSVIRRAMRVLSLRLIDSFGGLVIGAATGLVLVWVLGAAALHVPGQTGPSPNRAAVRRAADAQRRRTAIAAHGRDRARRPVPDARRSARARRPARPRGARSPRRARAGGSVVRVFGTACGLAVTGTGWVAKPGLVVTAAHVVAGQGDTVVTPRGGEALHATAVAFDPRNDVAVLRVPGLAVRPLPLDSPSRGDAVAILGFPGGGDYTAGAGRSGRPRASSARTPTATARCCGRSRRSAAVPPRATPAAPRERRRTRRGDDLRGPRGLGGRVRRPDEHRPRRPGGCPPTGLDRRLRALRGIGET